MLISCRKQIKHVLENRKLTSSKSGERASIYPCSRKEWQVIYVYARAAPDKGKEASEHGAAQRAEEISSRAVGFVDEGSALPPAEASGIIQRDKVQKLFCLVLFLVCYLFRLFDTMYLELKALKATTGNWVLFFSSLLSGTQAFAY